VNVKFTLKQATKAQRGSRGIALLFFNLGARGMWVVNSTIRPYYPRERPGTHCTGGWVGPMVGLDGCRRSRPHGDSIPGPSSPWRVAKPTALSRLTCILFIVVCYLCLFCCFWCGPFGCSVRLLKNKCLN
jgi:hypothetical protein